MRRLTSDRQSGASCNELQEESLLLGIETAQHLKQKPDCTAAEKRKRYISYGSGEVTFTYNVSCREYERSLKPNSIVLFTK